MRGTDYKAIRWLYGLIILSAIGTFSVLGLNSLTDVSLGGPKTTFLDTLNATPIIERATLKGREIAKASFTTRYTSTRFGIEIEVVSVSAINNGIEVFARAWRDGQQLGFGDGTIDIERFKIFNPPILVEDPSGAVVRSYPVRNPTTNQITGTETRRFRLDPKTAILESLAHTMSLSGKTGTQIVAGKRGSTVSTYYPAAGNSGGSTDCGFWNNNSSWAATRGDASADDQNDTDASNYIHAQNADPNWYIMRAMWSFNTSDIGTDAISSAVLSLASYNGTAAYAGGYDVDIVAATPADTDDFSADDFDQVGTTAFASVSYQTFDNASAGDYIDFTLNAGGIANIQKAGVSVFGGRNSADTDNINPAAYDYVNLYLADQGGTTYDPKLVVTHAAAVEEVGEEYFIIIE